MPLKLTESGASLMHFSSGDRGPLHVRGRERNLNFKFEKERISNENDKREVQPFYQLWREREKTYLQV